MQTALHTVKILCKNKCVEQENEVIRYISLPTRMAGLKCIFKVAKHRERKGNIEIGIGGERIKTRN